ncbi:MAG: FAD/NAD(P)-binding oxidoreductase [Candidatus Firestonebacteria bacterium]
MRYVIIGFSVSAVNAIKSIREVDKTGEIIVLTDEASIYSRPLISYYLAGKVKKYKLSFVDASFAKEMNINIRWSTPVKKIDEKGKSVVTAKNEKIKYDRLLISTGGIPIKPPIDGYSDDIAGVFTFIKLEEIEKLIKYIDKNKIKECVVLGAGLIGMKAAEGLLARKIKIKIVELADRLLANTFDKTASVILEERLKESGSEFLCETTIKKVVSKSKKLEGVVLSTGKTIKTKLLIVAVGVKPNLELTAGTTIKTNRGIVVNERMESSVPNIFAAGDAAEGADFLTGSSSVIAIWPVAARQGMTAGFNMAGKITEYDGMFPMNSVTIMDVPSISFGLTNPKINDYEVLSSCEKGKYKKIVIKNNVIVGVVLVNVIERAGIFGLIIKQKLDVSAFKKQLLKEDFGFLVLPKDFRKHYVTGDGTEV